MHVGSCHSPVSTVSASPTAFRIKAKLLFPAFWAFNNQIPNCFSRLASTSPLDCALPVCSFSVRCSLELDSWPSCPSVSVLPDWLPLIPPISPQNASSIGYHHCGGFFLGLPRSWSLCSYNPVEALTSRRDLCVCSSQIRSYHLLCLLAFVNPQPLPQYFAHNKCSNMFPFLPFC